MGVTITVPCILLGLQKCAWMFDCVYLKRAPLHDFLLTYIDTMATYPWQQDKHMDLSIEPLSMASLIPDGVDP